MFTQIDTAYRMEGSQAATAHAMLEKIQRLESVINFLANNIIDSTKGID